LNEASDDLSNSRKVVVAVIDASEAHRRQVAQALTSFYRVVTFGNSDEAIAALRSSPPCAMLVDHGSRPLSGSDFVKSLRRESLFTSIPVIFTGNADEANVRAAAADCGADAFLAKPFRRSELIRALSQQINKTVETKWEALPSLQRSALSGTMDVFNSISDVIEKDEPIAYAKVLEACGPLVEAVCTNEYKEILNGVRDHDNYSYAHSLGVATLLLLFGHTIGLKEPDLSLLGTGGLLHDVGKMLIPYDVLNKPGRLASEEFEVMKSHVPLTLQYINKSHDLPKNLLAIAAQHHERLDGSGYPLGLKSGELNELARMTAIVDVFCALSERRVYRPPVAAEKALEIMTDQMSTALDQKLLSLFREMLLDAGRQS